MDELKQEQTTSGPGTTDADRETLAWVLSGPSELLHYSLAKLLRDKHCKVLEPKRIHSNSKNSAVFYDWDPARLLYRSCNKRREIGERIRQIFRESVGDQVEVRKALAKALSGTTLTMVLCSLQRQTAQKEMDAKSTWYQIPFRNGWIVDFRSAWPGCRDERPFDPQQVIVRRRTPTDLFTQCLDVDFDSNLFQRSRDWTNLSMAKLAVEFPAVYRIQASLFCANWDSIRLHGSVIARALLGARGKVKERTMLMVDKNGEDDLVQFYNYHMQALKPFWTCIPRSTVLLPARPRRSTHKWLLLPPVRICHSDGSEPGKLRGGRKQLSIYEIHRNVDGDTAPQLIETRGHPFQALLNVCQFIPLANLPEPETRPDALDLDRISYCTQTMQVHRQANDRKHGPGHTTHSRTVESILADPVHCAVPEFLAWISENPTASKDQKHQQLLRYLVPYFQSSYTDPPPFRAPPDQQAKTELVFWLIQLQFALSAGNGWIHWPTDHEMTLDADVRWPSRDDNRCIQHPGARKRKADVDLAPQR